MATTLLPSASAYNPGADLWIVPHFDQHPMVANIDWHLNFQLNKAIHHQPPTSFSTKSVSRDLLPVLVPSQLHFPNRWILFLPSQNPKSWIGDISNYWKKLGQPTVRIFLPHPLTRQDFTHAWNELNHSSECTVIEA